VPDAKSRYEILQIHTRGMPIERDAEEKTNKYLMYLAERTQGFVGADLLALVQEAAMRYLRENLSDLDLEKEAIPPERLEKIVVTKKNFEDALMEAEARKNFNLNYPK
jgi:transitional endoplasmic reticulum ATPase